MLNVIVNPNIRKMEKLVAEVDSRFKERGVACRFFYSARRGDARKYAQSLTAAGQTELVVMGGDGTVNDVLSGMADPSVVRLGIIPAGTGNDFAAVAGIPLGIKAVDLILDGEPQPTDYIECGTHRSLNIAGTGMDVEILRRCENMTRGGRKGKYFRSLLATVFKYKGSRISVTAGGETREYNALIAAVCNGKRLGGGIPLCPAAQIDDGLMELVVVERPPRGKLLPALFRLMRGKILEEPITHHMSCRAASVVSPEGKIFVQYDGEIFEEEALNAYLVSGRLHVWRG